MERTETVIFACLELGMKQVERIPTKTLGAWTIQANCPERMQAGVTEANLQATLHPGDRYSSSIGKDIGTS